MPMAVVPGGIGLFVIEAVRQLVRSISAGDADPGHATGSREGF
jgi:hypothetical protein